MADKIVVMNGGKVRTDRHPASKNSTTTRQSVPWKASIGSPGDEFPVRQTRHRMGEGRGVRIWRGFARDAGGGQRHRKPEQARKCPSGVRCGPEGNTLTSAKPCVKRKVVVVEAERGAGTRRCMPDRGQGRHRGFIAPRHQRSGRAIASISSHRRGKELPVGSGVRRPDRLEGVTASHGEGNVTRNTHGVILLRHPTLASFGVTHSARMLAARNHKPRKFLKNPKGRRQAGRVLRWKRFVQVDGRPVAGENLKNSPRKDRQRGQVGKPRNWEERRTSKQRWR